MKNRAMIPLVLGVIVGLVALKFGVDTVRKSKGATAPVSVVPALVATQDIGASMRITPDMLSIKQTPKTPLLPVESYTSPDDIVGRVTAKFIPQGVPIVPNMIAPEGSIPGIEERIPEGFRAVAVKIDESTGVGYLLRPGSFVDVTVVMDKKRKGGSGKAETISRTILQRVEVAAVGQTLNEQAEGDEQGSQRVKSVTLIVPEQDVPKLHLAQTKGRLTLAMRSQDDSLLADTSEASEGELFGEAKQDEPQVAVDQPDPDDQVVIQKTEPVEEKQQGPYSVMVVQGNEMIRMTFSDPFSMNLLGISRDMNAGQPSGGMNSGYGVGQGAPLPNPYPRLSERERYLRRIGAQSGNQGGYGYDYDYDETPDSSGHSGE